MKRDLSGIIILLGAPNDDAGRLSSIAEERCRQALVEYRSRSGYAVLPTGGFGEHFNRTAKPHAHYTRRYLLDTAFRPRLSSSPSTAPPPEKTLRCPGPLSSAAASRT